MLRGSENGSSILHEDAAPRMSQPVGSIQIAVDEGRLLWNADDALDPCLTAVPCIGWRAEATG